MKTFLNSCFLVLAGSSFFRILNVLKWPVNRSTRVLFEAIFLSLTILCGSKRDCF